MCGYGEPLCDVKMKTLYKQTIKKLPTFKYLLSEAMMKLTFTDGTWKKGKKERMNRRVQEKNQ